MKKYFDKIVLFIFYTLCLIAFFLLVCELPNLLNDLFNTHIFENTTILSFIFCIFVLGYIIKYYEDKSNKNESQQRILQYNKLIGLNNIHTLNFDNLKTISNIVLSPTYNANITLSNEYHIVVDLQYFAFINTQEKLNNFDNFITEYMEMHADTIKSKELFEYNIQKTLISYLTNLEEN